ncbi:MAG: tetratricopeptide repeat protein [Deltaproteobacteria bacterium]|nr:tetratricopeptide repeat protein [Deltaproteobacteria bacterium]
MRCSERRLCSAQAFRIVCLAMALLGAACAARRIDRAVAKADALRGTQQYEAALKAYERIVLEYPTHPKIAEVLLRIGDLHHYTFADPERAAVAYQRIVTEWAWQPATSAAYRRLAELATGSDDHHAAINYYEQLLKYFPAHVERDVVRHLIGVSYFKQGQYAQARIELRGLLERDDVRPEVRAKANYDLAETYVAEHRSEAAIPYYERFVADYPEGELTKQAQLQLLQCYAEAGEMAKAMALEQTLRRQFPRDPVVQNRLQQVQKLRATVGRPGKLPWAH